MGELADARLNGDDCEECGRYIGEGSGFPRKCVQCVAEDDRKTDKKKKKRKKKKLKKLK